MANYPIKKFWTKLLASSRSPNKIPLEYLSTAENVRIFDGWIWPRRGREILTNSTLWTNKGWFIMNNNLYQIANSRIYEVNKDTWVQTQKAILPYNWMTDILVYKDFAIIVSNWRALEVFNGTWLETTPTTVPFWNKWIIEFTRWFSFLAWWTWLDLNIEQFIWTSTFYFWNDIIWSDYWEHLRQSFTIDSAIDNPTIKLYLSKIWSPLDNITVWIYRSSSNTLITNTVNIAWTWLTSSEMETEISLTGSLTLLTIGAYYIKITRSWALDDLNYYWIIHTDNVYSWWLELVFQRDVRIEQNLDSTQLFYIWRFVPGWWNDEFVKQTFTLSSSINNPTLEVYINSLNWTTLRDIKVAIHKNSDDSLLSSTIIPYIWFTDWLQVINFTVTLTDTTSEAYYFLFSALWPPNTSQFSTFYGITHYSANPGVYSGGALSNNSGTVNTFSDLKMLFYQNTIQYRLGWDTKFTLRALYVTPQTWWSLHISRPITDINPEYSYDFTWAWSQNITYDDNIVGLEWTLNWIYIFTETKVDFLWSNALQNVAWSATFITTTLWKSWCPINNNCIASSWDKIFFITKSLQLQTINYVAWTENASIGTLSSQAIIWIKELLNTIDTEQPTAFAVYNKKDETMQFHIRTAWSSYNDICLIYDLINNTFSIDTWKNYNYVVEYWKEYFWFSDINTSIYKDDNWKDDNWNAIISKVITHEMNLWTIKEKLFEWFYIAWWIWYLTNLAIRILIDEIEVFNQTITWNTNWVLEDFEKEADKAMVYRTWKKIQIEITSSSLNQDYLLDILWVLATYTQYWDINNKF